MFDFMLFLLILKLLIPKYDRDPLMEDLRLQYEERIRRTGSFRAGIWFRFQVIRSLPGFLLANFYWRFGLVRNYIMVAVRHMKKERIYSFINITGLAIGMACCILIFLFVDDELRFDKYHEHAESIFRITTLEENGYHHYAGAAFGAMRRCADEIPEISMLTRFFRRDGLISIGKEKHEIEHILIADSTFFRVFSYKFTAGEGAAALDIPRSIILTQKTAERLFGTEDPIGRTVELYGEGELTVRGIIDEVPLHSHFKFNAVVTNTGRQNGHPWQSWFGIAGWAYIRVQEGTDPVSIGKKLTTVYDRHLGEHGRAIGLMPEFNLQRLTDIHLRSHLEFEIDTNGDLSSVWILSAIAVFILLIACLNFINLSTARYVSRGKETGIRKVLGANRARLVFQFLGEALTYAGMAFILAVVIVGCLYPFFTSATGRMMRISSLFEGNSWLWILLLILITGIGSGIYPAFFLSGFKPAVVLHGAAARGSIKSRFRKILVVFQFFISILLIAGTLIVIDQIRYMKRARLGLDERVFVIPLQVGVLFDDYDVFKEQLLIRPGVLNAALANDYPGRGIHVLRYVCEGKPEHESVQVHYIQADYDFAETYSLDILSGRDFSRKMGSDSGVYLINERAAEFFEWGEKAIGKQIWHRPSDRDMIVGIIRDFHFHSFHEPIKPLIIRCTPGIGSAWSEKYLAVKMRSEGLAATVDFIRKTWKKFNEGYGFNGFFIDDKFHTLYRAEERLSKISAAFSGIAIFIACLGLLGLISFSVEQRTKEIGIRKSLGASAGSVILLLSREYSGLVILANALALPAAYLVMKRFWLTNFAYRIDPSPYIFIIACLISLLMALISVGFQSLRASRARPVDALRYE